jgi:PAS domain S-box-containing protein
MLVETDSPRAYVLIVEDEYIIAEDLQSRLTKMGYAVVGIVTSGEEAVEKSREIRPDLVLMDIVLSGNMNGIEAAEQIRFELDVSVVFITAYADDKRLDRAKLALPFGYVLKPFQDRDIRITMEMALHTTQVDAARRAAEVALKESEERYRRMFEAAILGIFQITPAGEILEVNPSFARMFGYETPEELKREMGNAENLHSVPKSRRDLVTKIVQERKPTVFEREYVRRDGTEFTGYLYVWTISDDQGDVEYLEGFIEDITLRKEAEEALRKREADYRKLLDNAIEAILIVQGETLRFANPQATEITGYSIEEITNKPFIEFIHPEDRDKVWETYQQRLSGREVPKVFPMRIIHRDGSVKWVETKSVLFEWENQPAVLTFCSDVTACVEKNKTGQGSE